MIKTTPHPPWVTDLLEFSLPLTERVVNHKIFADIGSRGLTLRQFRAALLNFYPLMARFRLRLRGPEGASR